MEPYDDPATQSARPVPRSCETIRYGHVGRVVRLTINRPAAMNAIDPQAWQELGDAFETFANDPDAWVLVLTGAGTRAFCAGADLKAVAAGGFDQQTAEMRRWGFGGLVRQHTDKPMIAAVNGFALGGGTEFALFCDLIVASDTASFGLPEVRRGLIASGGGLLRLPMQLPLKVAMHHILTGDPMSAHEAERWGLVNQVVPPERVVPAAMELAARLCECSPIAVRTSKNVVHRTLLAAVDGAAPAWAISDEGAARNRASADAAEGPRAFAEKRAPVWQGR